MSPTATPIDWLATAAVSAGTVVFGLATRRVANGYAKQSPVSLVFVPLVATTLHLMTAMGPGGSAVQGKGRRTEPFTPGKEALACTPPPHQPSSRRP